MVFGVAEPDNMSFVPMHSATTCILVASDLLSRRRSSSIVMPLKPLTTQSSATSRARSRLVIESPKQRLPNGLAGISKQNFLAGDWKLGFSFDVCFPVMVLSRCPASGRSSRLVIESPKQRLPNGLAGISKQNFLAGDWKLGFSFDVCFPVMVLSRCPASGRCSVLAVHPSV